MKSAVVIFALAVVLFHSLLPAQTAPAYSQNAVYFEALGQGILYSINFDHRFSENIAVRAGFSSFNVDIVLSDFTITTIPLMLEFLSGHGSSHFEFGVGIVPIHGSSSENFLGLGSNQATGKWVVVGTMTVGYRYQPPGEGFLFRIGVTPLLASDPIPLWGGISLGYAF